MKNIQSPELDLLVKRFTPYLKEVRNRVYFTLFVFFGAMIAGFVFYEKIIKFLIDLLSLEGVNIVFTSPFQFINLSITCGLVTGIVATIPLLISQILSFLKPALRLKEFKTVVRLLPFSIVLFIIGFVFGALIMKWQIQIFLERSISLNIGNVLDISGLLTTVLLTSVFMGIGFQMPIILALLMRIGIVSSEQLKKIRPWVYLFSFVFALFLPLDSILADIFLSLPLIILFELTLLFGAKNKNKRLQKEK